MKMRKNAWLTLLRREEMARNVLAGRRAATRRLRRSASRPRRRPSGSDASGTSAPPARGPLIEAAPVARAHAGACRWADRLLVAPSPGRRPHRRGDRRLAGHDRPGPQARRPVPAQGAGAGGPRPSLSARPPGRHDPYRHQALRSLRQVRAPSHRHPGRSPPRGPAGNTRLCVDDASRVACGGPFPDEKRQGVSGCLRASAGRSGASGPPPAGYERQRPMLRVQGVRLGRARISKE